jgi:multicomponent Na+:H+ antiporter subunit D
MVTITKPDLAGAGVILVLVSLASKAAIAPLHAWAGPALGRGNAVVSLAVGAVGVLGALAVLVRFSAHALTAPQIGAGVSMALGVLGAFAIVIGAVQAVGARNLPRLAIYAGGSQAGCAVLGVALGSPAGIAASLVQLLAIAAATLALLGAAATARVQQVSMLDGFGQRAPLASAAITAGALSLMGAPLTLGFLGRWRLVEAGVGAGWWWAIALVAIASLAGVFYGGRLIERMYFRRATETFPHEGTIWRFALAPALLAAIGITMSGLAPGGLLRLADAAAALVGPAT